MDFFFGWKRAGEQTAYLIGIDERLHPLVRDFIVLRLKFHFLKFLADFRRFKTQIFADIGVFLTPSPVWGRAGEGVKAESPP
jgi:hypothetical protein